MFSAFTAIWHTRAQDDRLAAYLHGSSGVYWHSVCRQLPPRFTTCQQCGEHGALGEGEDGKVSYTHVQQLHDNMVTRPPWSSMFTYQLFSPITLQNMQNWLKPGIVIHQEFIIHSVWCYICNQVTKVDKKINSFYMAEKQEACDQYRRICIV